MFPHRFLVLQIAKYHPYCYLFFVCDIVIGDLESDIFPTLDNCVDQSHHDNHEGDIILLYLIFHNEHHSMENRLHLDVFDEQ